MSIEKELRAENRLHLCGLFARVTDGDRRAFAEFYDLTVGRVHGLVRRCLVDFAQSEEVSQEVYLEVWQNARRFDEAKGDVLAWVFTIAHRRAIDRVRASQASRTRDVVVGIRDREFEFDSVAEAAEVHLEHERARQAMAVLTDLQRQSIRLAFFDGLTPYEIADQLGLPVSTVKTRIRDGLLRMRRELTSAA